MSRRPDLALRSAVLRQQSTRLQKRALVARLAAMGACLRSEDVAVTIAVDRMVRAA